MSEEIEIRFNWGDVDVPRLQRLLAKRFYRRWGWREVGFVSALLSGFALALAENSAGSAMPGFWAALFGVGVFVVLGRGLNKRLMRAMSDAPARREPNHMIYDRLGITAPGSLVAGRLPWRWVTDVVETETALLVLYSPLEFLVVPDSALPVGLTRAALMRKIADWRAAAT